MTGWKKIRDWNISRQVVWGPRIQVWYCLDCNPEIFLTFVDSNGQKVSGTYKELKDKYSFEEIKKGLQSLVAPQDATYSLKQDVCEKCGGSLILQETDTFDTWFLSGQWPLTTLGFPNSEDFKYFYPTSVLDTLWDILFFWVARMMMFGLYRAGDVPFKTVHIHARVVDRHGQKMSKSKGNVINPIDMVEKYGADALRLALVIGVAPAGDVSISEEKIKGMRNFCNKLWNISRFILMNTEGKEIKNISKAQNESEAINWSKERNQEIQTLAKEITKLIENNRFGQASEELYQYAWHQFADIHLETAKKWLYEEAEDSVYVRGTLLEMLETILKLLHPFMPFITEEIWQKLPERKNALIVASWPK